MSRAVSNSSIMLGPSGKSSTLLPTKQTSWAVGPGSEAASLYLERLEKEKKEELEAEERRKAAEEMENAQRAVDPLKARRRLSIAEVLCDSAFVGKTDVEYAFSEQFVHDLRNWRGNFEALKQAERLRLKRELGNRTICRERVFNDTKKLFHVSTEVAAPSFAQQDFCGKRGGIGR